MLRTLGWNRSEARVDLDQLVTGLQKLGGRPRLLAVRTPTLVDWSSSPPPLAGGVFEGSRVGFFALRENGNGQLLVRYGVFPRPLLAVSVSALVWALFPILVTLAARWMYRPQGREAPEGRWDKAVKALRYATGIGAYVTLFFQKDVLKHITLPASGLSPPFDTLDLWTMPFSFMLYAWAGAVWTLLGPGQRSRQKSTVLKILGGGVASVALYLLIFGVMSTGAGTGNLSLGINRIAGALVGLSGLFMLGLFCLSESKLKRIRKGCDDPGVVPDDDAGRRQLLQTLVEKASTPEELAREEAALAKIDEKRKAFRETLRGLSPEEKSWLALANRLALQHGGNRLFKQTNPLLHLGLLLITSAAICWMLPGVLGLLAVFAGLSLMGLVTKSASKVAVVPYTRGQVDFQVARLLDDPERYVQVLRRLEAVENDSEGPATQLMSTRRQALEKALREEPVGS